MNPIHLFFKASIAKLKSIFIVLIFQFIITTNSTGQDKTLYFKFLNSEQIDVTSIDTKKLNLKNDHIIQKLEDKVLAQITFPLTKAQPEGTLGNWLSDLCFEYLNSHFDEPIQACFIAYNSIHSSYIAPGALHLKDVYNLFPYPTPLFKIKMSGKELTQLCDSIAAQGGCPIKGIQFSIKNNKANNIRIQKQTIGLNYVYIIAADRFFIKQFIEPLSDTKIEQIDLGIQLQNIVLKQYLDTTQKHMISSNIDHRIYYED